MGNCTKVQKKDQNKRQFSKSGEQPQQEGRINNAEQIQQRQQEAFEAKVATHTENQISLGELMVLETRGGPEPGEEVNVSPQPQIQKAEKPESQMPEVKDPKQAKQLNGNTDAKAISQQNKKQAGEGDSPAYMYSSVDLPPPPKAENGAESGAKQDPVQKSAPLPMVADADTNIECTVCAMTVNTSEARQLACEHAFHEDCLQGYFEMKIEAGEVGMAQLVCPNDDGCQPISEILLRETVSKELFDMYLDKVSKLDPVINESQGARQIHCPGPDCFVPYILEPKHNQFYKCKNDKCGITFCTYCMMSHAEGTECNRCSVCNKIHQGTECQRELADDERTCPHCKEVIRRTGGCNHMTCRSKECDGQKEFCWCCSQIVNAPGYDSLGDHFTSGFFNPCRVVSSI